MKKFLIGSLLGFAAAFVLVFSTGCASTVTADVVRPAEMDLNGAQSISVLEFTPSKRGSSINLKRGSRVTVLDVLSALLEPDEDTDETECLDYLRTELERKLLNSGHFSVVSAKVVQNELEKGKKASADVYLVGQLTRFKVKDETIDRKKVVNDETFYVKDYRRCVEFNFVYEVIDSATDSIIGYREFPCSRTSSVYEKKSQLPSAFSVAEYGLNDIVKSIQKDLEPYTERKSFKMLSSKVDGMKEARTIAKNGDISGAGKKFLQIYNDTGTFEAGYNAALMLEVLGKYDKAEELMSKVATESANKKAYKALSDIRSEKQKYEKLLRQESGFEERKAEKDSDEWGYEAPKTLNFDDIDW